MISTTLETQDLIIRRTVFDDLDQFFLWEQRPEVTEFFSIRDGQTREEVYHKFFTDEDDPAAEQFTILLKCRGGDAGDGGAKNSAGVGEINDNTGGSDAGGSTGYSEANSGALPDHYAANSSLSSRPGPAIIGRIVLADIIPGWKAELWRIYIGDASLRGRGYGRQAMEAMMKYCFEDLNLQRLYLDHYTGNPAGFLYENLGFQREGILRKNCRKNGVLYDVHLMSMLREEYFSK